MAVGVPVGTRSLMRRSGQRKRILLEKVSHHGPKWERWRPVEQPNGRKPRQTSASKIRANAYYPLIHGIPKTPEVAEAIAALSRRPIGLIVMVPCRTKFEAFRVTRRAEFAGAEWSLVRGDRILNHRYVEKFLSGYQRYVPDDGQAWFKKPKAVEIPENDAEVNQ